MTSADNEKEAGSQMSGAVAASVKRRLKHSNTDGAIGPSVLRNNIDALVNDVRPHNWKNVPVPICSSTQQIVDCINDLKKFVIMIETKLSNNSHDVKAVKDDQSNMIKRFKDEMDTSFKE